MPFRHLYGIGASCMVAIRCHEAVEIAGDSP